MPTSANTPPTAATSLVRSLQTHGTDRVFCVAGESYLPVLDALHDAPGIDVVTCRHEASAGFMALTDAKLTGRPGVCLVSRGPGASNAAIAVHAAAEDATALLVLVGGVPLPAVDREAFQSLDGRPLDGMAKAAWTVHDPASAAEFVTRAFRVAAAGTPGPVVLTLPEDILDRPHPGPPGAPGRLATPALAQVHLELIGRRLSAALRPLLLAGELLDHDAGRALLRTVAERHDIPVVTGNKQQHLLPNRHPLYAGHLHNATQLGQLAAYGRADLVLAVGTRLDRATTRGHRFPRAPRPDQPLVHVHPDAGRIGAVHQPWLGCPVDPVAFLRELAARPAGTLPEGRARWAEELHAIEADKAVWHPVTAPDGVVFGAVAAALDELTGGDATVVVDSGTFTSWVYRYVRFGERGRLIGISSSSMGYAMGAGVSAALRANGTPTVVVVGDGGFLMNPGELMTACERRLPLTYIVADNRSYATIRLHQERRFPGRTVGTTLTNPDFAALAESFGALGLTASGPEQVRPCLAKALEHPGPSVVAVTTSLEFITAHRRLGVDGRGLA